MNARTQPQRGTTLVIGVILLSMVTLLGLAGASTARVERLLAQNELFREKAAAAASAGIESAMGQIVISANPTAVATKLAAMMPGSSDKYEATTRFAGFELALPQLAGAALAGAHFEISSSGFSGRATVRERVDVLLVIDAPAAVAALDCAPVVSTRCYARGEWVRLAWQREPVE